MLSFSIQHFLLPRGNIYSVQPIGIHDSAVDCRLTDYTTNFNKPECIPSSQGTDYNLG